MKQLFISISVHLFLFLIASVIFLYSSGIKKNPNALAGYLYQENQSPSQQPVMKHSSSEKKQSPSHITSIQKTEKNNTSSHLASQKQMIQNIGNEENHRELLKILHNLIAEKQRYPESAIALNQSGVVEIGMTIHPDGQIKNITVLKSSGFDIIDAAAIDSVQATSPIHNAEAYLKQVEYFSIAIVFKI